MGGQFFNTMIFYHGTKPQAWKDIQKEGVLWGKGMNYRFTYLTPIITMARKYGNVILAVNYTPLGTGLDSDNYPPGTPPPGKEVWQFSVFQPIPITRVRRLTTPEITRLTIKRWLHVEVMKTPIKFL